MIIRNKLLGIAFYCLVAAIFVAPTVFADNTTRAWTNRNESVAVTSNNFWTVGNWTGGGSLGYDYYWITNSTPVDRTNCAYVASGTQANTRFVILTNSVGGLNKVYISNGGSMNLSQANKTVIGSNGLFEIAGYLIVYDTATISLQSGGTLFVNGGSINESGSAWNMAFSGTFIGNSATNAPNGSGNGFLVQSNGLLRASGNIFYFNTGAATTYGGLSITNGGTLEVDSGATFILNRTTWTTPWTNTGTIFINGGTLATYSSGSANTALTNYNTGAISGSGTILCNVISRGSINPGGVGSIGNPLYLGANLILSNNPTINFDLSGTDTTEGGGINDEVKVTSTVTLNAATTINATLSSQPAGSVSYTLMTYAGTAGTTNFTVGTITPTPVSSSLSTNNSKLVLNLTYGVVHTITATAGSNGSISPSGAVQVFDSSNQTFSVTANQAYHVDDVLVDSVSVGAVSSYTFTNVTTDHTISATFAINANTHTITASAGSNGSISPSGAVLVDDASNQTFNVTGASCYHVADVLVDSSSVGAVSSYTFTNVTADHTISASFAINTYTITASADANGTITPSGGVSVNCGSNQGFTITPNPCYQVANVLVDSVSVGAVSSYTFTNVTAAHTISASFAGIPYTITASAGTGGTISPSGAVSVNCGNNTNFTITPNSGSGTWDVLVDSSSVGPVSSYTFTNVTAAHTINASFTIYDTWTFTPAAGTTITNIFGSAGATNWSLGHCAGNGETGFITNNTPATAMNVLIRSNGLYTIGNQGGIVISNSTGAGGGINRLMVSNSSTLNFDNLVIGSNGVVEVDGSGTLTVNNTMTLNSGGTLAIIGGSKTGGTNTFQNNGLISMQNGTLGGRAPINRGTLSGYGTISVSAGIDNNGGTLAVTGGSMNVTNISGALVITNGTVLVNSGTLIPTLDWGFGGAMTLDSGSVCGSTSIGGGGSRSFHLLSEGQIIANSGVSYIDTTNAANFGGMTIDSGGTLQVNSGATFVFARSTTGWTGGAPYGTNSGTIFMNGGTFTTYEMGTNNTGRGIVSTSTGAIKGIGTIKCNLISAGSLSPGSSAGSLTVDGNLTLRPSSALPFELGGYTPGTQHDLIIVTKAAAFDGMLTVQFINGFEGTVTNGASFTVLTANSISGAFTNVANGGTLQTLDGMGTFTVSYSGSSLVLSGLVLSNATHIISASAGNNGSISPSGAVVVTNGNDQPFTITADACYHVADVLVDSLSVGPVSSYTFTNVTTAHTISASFATDTYTITASAGAHGSINPTGGVSVNCGSNQDFAITADIGHHIADVLVDSLSVGPVSSYTITNVTATHTISASFAIDTFTITASAGTNGAISPNGAVSVGYGNDQGFTISPDACYHIVDVLVDSMSIGPVSSYTFTNVTAGHTIDASFAIDTFTITASAGTNGAISPNGVVSVNCGTNQDFIITAGPGYPIVDVLVDSVSVGPISSYTFTNVTASHTIDASFATNLFQVLSIKREGGDVRVTWATVGGHDYVVQTNAPPPGGSYTNNFSDLTTISVPGIGESTTNYLDVGAATNSPSRYYRLRLVQ